MADAIRRVVNEIRHANEWRLSTKIMIVFMVVAMGAIFFFSRQSEARATETLTNAQSKLLTSLASSVAIQVESQVLQYRRDAVQVATDPEVITYMTQDPSAQSQNGAALLRRLAPALTADPDYRLLLILNPSGKVVISNEVGVQAQDFGSKEFFTRGLAAPASDPYISDISLAEDRRSQIIYVALPIRDAVGKVLGVAAVRLAPDHVAAPLKSKELATQHRDGYLVSRQGVILANSVNPDYNYRVLGGLDAIQTAQVKQQYGLDNVTSLGQNDLHDKIAGATDSGFTKAHLVNSKETDVIGWAPVPEQRWTVMVSENQSIFTAEVSDLSRTQFFNAAFLALIIGSLVIFAGRLFESTERESLSDPLTGLANRRFLQEIMLRELRRAQRSNQPVSLIIADIDHFKGVNDTYGHNVGDEVLEQIAGIMLSSVRATDFVIRYGGEEFVILMPETRPADAAQVADKLRKTIGDTIMESTSRPGITLKVTISAGVAAFPVDGQTGEAVILKADKALYWAKQHGRNIVASIHEIENGEADGETTDKIASIDKR
jgi:diguanylate cyclase (GGDEF)-like protein